jgi:hypothetical protein
MESLASMPTRRIGNLAVGSTGNLGQIDKKRKSFDVLRSHFLKYGIRGGDASAGLKMMPMFRQELLKGCQQQ